MRNMKSVTMLAQRRESSIGRNRHSRESFVSFELGQEAQGLGGGIPGNWICPHQTKEVWNSHAQEKIVEHNLRFPGVGEVIKNLSSLLPPAPAPCPRLPTWPITCSTLLFFLPSSQVSTHLAPAGHTQRWGVRGLGADSDPLDQGGRFILQATLPWPWASTSFLLPILVQCPQPKLKTNKKTHQKSTRHMVTWVL